MKTQNKTKKKHKNLSKWEFKLKKNKTKVSVIRIHDLVFFVKNQMRHVPVYLSVNHHHVRHHHGKVYVWTIVAHRCVSSIQHQWIHQHHLQVCIGVQAQWVQFVHGAVHQDFIHIQVRIQRISIVHLFSKIKFEWLKPTELKVLHRHPSMDHVLTCRASIKVLPFI